MGKTSSSYRNPIQNVRNTQPISFHYRKNRSFPSPVPAREARQLGAALISYTCNRTRQISFSSYDRFFPNQDTLPKGGFGNLIALPLQKQLREQGRSVFVDENFEPHQDQWTFLTSVRPMSGLELGNAILRASDGRHPLDVAFVSEEDENKPWQRCRTTASSIVSASLPESLTLVLANQIFTAKADLSQPLANRLVRLAAFQNPEFYKAQAMRLPVWNKPRIIGCAENFPHHIGLPRGCLEAVQELLKQNNVVAEIQDERVAGCKVNVKFIGKLRKDQKAAVRAMLKQDVRIYDYVESEQPQLSRMWNKRQHGYRAMGYQIRPTDALISKEATNPK